MDSQNLVIMKDKALDLLIHSLDNELTPAQKEQLAFYFEEYPSLKEEEEKLRTLRIALSNLQTDNQSSIADKVIGKLSTRKIETDFQAVIMQLFPKVAAACLLVIVVTILATFYVEGSLSADALVGIQDLSPEDAYSILTD